MSNLDLTLSIPGYTLQKKLGSGAMASVYLAVQDYLDRPVALKVMSAGLTTDATFRERFIKEGKIIAQLNHPHIVTVYDIGIYQDFYYMAMEYIAGGTLKERIRKGLSPQQALTLFIQIASALGYAHQRGFVHRDVKPANILFRRDDEAVLSDFGIAKSTQQDSTQLTAAGWTLGTPNYMSPEQALGQGVDGRSDLYSLGVVLYEMLTKERPYQGTDSFSTALLHISAPIPRLPATLINYQAIIDRLLAKSPEARFAQASEAIAAGEQLLRRLSIPTPSQTSSEADATVVVAKQRTTAFPSDTLSTASGVLGASGLLTGHETKGTLPTQDAWAGTQSPLTVAMTQPTDAPSTVKDSPATEVLTSGLTHEPGSPEPRSTPWTTAGGSAFTAATEKVVTSRTWRSIGSGLLLLILGGVVLYSFNYFNYEPMIGFQALTAWLYPAPTTPTRPNYPADCPTLDSRTQSDVKTLLEVARSHQVMGYLTSPVGMNAVETYQRVLEIDPCNTQSKQQLNAIADYYFAQTRASVGKQEPISSSLQLAEAGLLAVPTHPELRTLRQQLRDRLNAHRGRRTR